MTSILACNRVRPPTTVRALARATGMSPPISVRELVELMGPAAYGPRPFYVVGHNPNTIADVREVLRAGANAIEPDVNVYDERPAELCISHGSGGADAPPLAQYLEELRVVAHEHPELALVVFDCKTSAPDHGTKLLAAAREHLAGTDLNVIVSVANFGHTALLEPILGGLGPREGAMIDSENDPEAVASWFTSRGTLHGCYGNGISVANEYLGPHVRPSMEVACAVRAISDQPRFIYVWTVNDADLIREYIAIGVDGIISDDVARLSGIARQFPSAIRLATRADNPFMPPNAAYALTVQTGGVSTGGTDANITFVLKGTNGETSETFATWRPARMERGQKNVVTLQSPDLGALESISVRRDESGNSPGWELDSIRVESFRYQVSKTATFNSWIGTTPLVRRL